MAVVATLASLVATGMAIQSRVAVHLIAAPVFVSIAALACYRATHVPELFDDGAHLVIRRGHHERRVSWSEVRGFRRLLPAWTGLEAYAVEVHGLFFPLFALLDPSAAQLLQAKTPPP